ncbi:alpha/beta hydrolase [Thalassotalea psychrophila]|uniref:Alpha/beta hydrolase n=1 Tax=Thalassotalea psychrophila TaxID=3065647 RepID=A0ABY9TUQ3_9GAMM|nr:alpha/beta hydrolase [Colwelliaceae bacterium SQ149]
MSEQSNINKGYANTDFGQVHYLTAGDKSKPVLVLLHQAPSCAEMYRIIMPFLTEHFYCIAPDFIGFGQSDGINLGAHSIDLYGDSVVQCLQHIGVNISENQAAIFGHHTGAAVAKYIASNYPYLCERLIMSGPTLMPADLCAALPAKVALPEPDEGGEYIANIWQKMRGKDSDVDIAIAQRETCLAIQMGEHYQAAYKAVANFDAAAALRKIQCKTLVFAGDRDVLQPYIDDSLALLKMGTKVEIGDTTTYVCETHPQQVANIIINFLR